MVDFESMSIPEIKALIEEAEAAILRRRLRAQSELRARLAAEAAELGFSLEDVLKEFADAKPLERGVKGTEYRNPEDPSKVWRGEGKKPRWVKEYEAGGGLLSDLAQKPSDTAGRRTPKVRDKSETDVWI